MTAELDALAARAQTIDADAGQVGADAGQVEPEAGQLGPEPPADAGRELRAIFEAMRAIARVRGFTRTAAALDDQSIEAMVLALLPVLEKYGISPSSVFGRWGAEVSALLVCGPVLWAVFVAMRADLEAKAAAAAKPINPDNPKPADVQPE